MASVKTKVIIEMEANAKMLWQAMQAETNEIKRAILRKAYYEQAALLKKQVWYTGEIGKKSA